MKKDEDFRIQEILDQKMKRSENLTSDIVDTDNLKAYELLYGHLNEKPGQGLSLSFKSNVLKRIEMEKKLAKDTQFYWLLGFVFLSGIVLIVSMFFVFKDALAPSLGVVGQHKGIIVIGIVAVVLFTIVEKRLTNTKFKSVL